MEEDWTFILLPYSVQPASTNVLHASAIGSSVNTTGTVLGVLSSSPVLSTAEYVYTTGRDRVLEYHKNSGYTQRSKRTKLL